MGKYICLLALFIISLQCISAENETHQLLAKHMNGPKKELFKAYHGLFKREYDLDSEEGFKRYKIFKQNMKEIKEGNLREGEGSYAMGPFTDITREDFEKTYLMDPVLFDKIMKEKKDSDQFDF